MNKASKKGKRVSKSEKQLQQKKFSKDGERWRKKYTSVCVCESVYVCVDRFLRDWQNWPQPRCIIDSGHKTLDRANVLLLIQVSQESEVGGLFLHAVIHIHGCFCSSCQQYVADVWIVFFPLSSFRDCLFIYCSGCGAVSSDRLRFLRLTTEYSEVQKER